jgi:hypothetical protein
MSVEHKEHGMAATQPGLNTPDPRCAWVRRSGHAARRSGWRSDRARSSAITDVPDRP